MISDIWPLIKLLVYSTSSKAILLQKKINEFIDENKDDNPQGNSSCFSSHPSWVAVYYQSQLLWLRHIHKLVEGAFLPASSHKGMHTKLQQRFCEKEENLLSKCIAIIRPNNPSPRIVWTICCPDLDPPKTLITFDYFIGN